jgi:hypothetical protein
MKLLEIIKKKINHVRWNFGAFYYSAEQEKRVGYNYFTPLFSKEKKMYSLWSSRFPFRHNSGWKDMRLVGFGFFHSIGHSTLPYISVSF